ncbi:hypothetical protein AVEN_251867-1 [Araneus ventricosus]|uniref:Uncharacterized protein n=1 Tax=Araneus ventricosus TaxID=182803 RepID=A0A4Y2R9D1_ARAVE|nr:hypothetical protein AVEN_251867-1 [Araneus ventricosus]
MRIVWRRVPPGGSSTSLSACVPVTNMRNSLLAACAPVSHAKWFIWRRVPVSLPGNGLSGGHAAGGSRPLNGYLAACTGAHTAGIDIWGVYHRGSYALKMIYLAALLAGGSANMIYLAACTAGGSLRIFYLAACTTGDFTCRQFIWRVPPVKALSNSLSGGAPPVAHMQWFIWRRYFAAGGSHLNSLSGGVYRWLTCESVYLAVRSYRWLPAGNVYLAATRHR